MYNSNYFSLDELTFVVDSFEKEIREYKNKVIFKATNIMNYNKKNGLNKEIEELEDILTEYQIILYNSTLYYEKLLENNLLHCLEEKKSDYSGTLTETLLSKFGFKFLSKKFSVKPNVDGDERTIEKVEKESVLTNPLDSEEWGFTKTLLFEKIISIVKKDVKLKSAIGRYQTSLKTINQILVDLLNIDKTSMSIKNEKNDINNIKLLAVNSSEFFKEKFTESIFPIFLYDYAKNA